MKQARLRSLGARSCYYRVAVLSQNTLLPSQMTDRAKPIDYTIIFLAQPCATMARGVMFAL